MEERTTELYLEYDQQRKTREARDADAEDEVELKSLESKLKRRPKN